MAHEKPSKQARNRHKVHAINPIPADSHIISKDTQVVAQMILTKKHTNDKADTVWPPDVEKRHASSVAPQRQTDRQDKERG